MVRKCQKVSEEIKAKKMEDGIGLQWEAALGQHGRMLSGCGEMKESGNEYTDYRGEYDVGCKVGVRGGDHKGTWDSSGGEKCEKLAARKTSNPASPTKLFHLLTLTLSPFI